MLLRYGWKLKYFMLNIPKEMLISENTIKTTAIILSNQLYIFYWRFLPYNLIIASYDIAQHVMILDLSLVQLNLNIHNRSFNNKNDTIFENMPNFIEI